MKLSLSQTYKNLETKRKQTLKYLKEMKSCPFCGGKVIISSEGDFNYFKCKHDPYCFMLNKSDPEDGKTHYDYTLIPNTERYRKAWNERNKNVPPKKNISGSININQKQKS